MAGLQLVVCQGEFMLLKDYIDKIPGVRTSQIHLEAKHGSDLPIPTLMMDDSMRDTPLPIICIKIKMKDESTLTYIPCQTIIQHPQRDQFIQNLDMLGDSNLIDSTGRLLIPKWCLLWNNSLKKYQLRFNVYLDPSSFSESKLDSPTDTPGTSTNLNPKHMEMELDQEADGAHYTMLLPQISFVLEGNVPDELVNKCLLARFQKEGIAEMVTQRFAPQQPLNEFLDNKPGALIMNASLSIIKYNIDENSGAIIRCIRKSVSSGVALPHLSVTEESKQKEFELICIRIRSRKFQCAFTYIPIQVVILDKIKGIIIYYLGLESDILTDTHRNQLRLPGLSIFIDRNSRYSMLIDVSLRYDNEGDVITIRSPKSNIGEESNSLNLSQLPKEYRLLDGQKPKLLAENPQKIMFSKSGRLYYHDSTARFEIRIAPPKPPRNMAFAGATGDSSAAAFLPPVTMQESISNALPNQLQKTLINGRFLFIRNINLPIPHLQVPLWKLVPVGDHLDNLKIPQVTDFYHLCIEMVFNEDKVLLYMPQQNIIYFEERNSIWTWESSRIFWSSQGKLVFAGDSLWRTSENRIEMVLNSHYQFEENGLIEKDQDDSVVTSGFIENFYLSPPPKIKEVLHGHLPAGLRVEDIRVRFPIHSPFVEIDNEYLIHLQRNAEKRRLDASTHQTTSGISFQRPLVAPITAGDYFEEEQNILQQTQPASADMPPRISRPPPLGATSQADASGSIFPSVAPPKPPRLSQLNPSFTHPKTEKFEGPTDATQYSINTCQYQHSLGNSKFITTEVSQNPSKTVKEVCRPGIIWHESLFEEMKFLAEISIRT